MREIDRLAEINRLMFQTEAIFHGSTKDSSTPHPRKTAKSNSSPEAFTCRDEPGGAGGTNALKYDWPILVLIGIGAHARAEAITA